MSGILGKQGAMFAHADTTRIPRQIGDAHLRHIIGLTVALVATWEGAMISSALAQETTAIEIVLKDHIYHPAELHVPAGKPIVITVKNDDATAEEFDSSALKIEKLIPGNSSATVRIRPLSAGRYSFIGEQHENSAKGVLVAE
jgi:plastocyanin